MAKGSERAVRTPPLANVFNLKARGLCPVRGEGSERAVRTPPRANVFNLKARGIKNNANHISVSGIF